MNKRIYKPLISVGSVLFWLLLWEIFSRYVSFSFILPGAGETLAAFLRLIPTADFWLTVLLSLFRILTGLIIGIALGVVLGYISAVLDPMHSFLSPIMTVVRCTPVASFIMIVWFMVKTDYIPTLIALFMVLPIIWQSTYDAFGRADKELKELAAVYGFNTKKRLKYVYAPTVNKYLVPAVITSLGLSWKAGVAAEIITHAKNSIGAEILDAKSILEGADMFAWTLTVVLLSLLLEFAVKRFLRRVRGI